MNLLQKLGLRLKVCYRVLFGNRWVFVRMTDYDVNYIGDFDVYVNDYSDEEKVLGI